MSRFPVTSLKHPNQGHGCSGGCSGGMFPVISLKNQTISVGGQNFSTRRNSGIEKSYFGSYGGGFVGLFGECWMMNEQRCERLQEDINEANLEYFQYLIDAGSVGSSDDQINQALEDAKTTLLRINRMKKKLEECC